ncbi:ABC transporter substrate-binding protein [Nocardioides sp.]|uniref:ABC transporter substrate-binding protein n=1 Tax=Nocardioides sp. TaxID=35761 RepID=UPI003D134D45
MTNRPVQGMGEGKFSRRQVLQYSGLAAAGITGMSALAACGGDDGGGGGGGGTGGAQKSGGILTHGATGGSSKDTIDPHAPVTNPDIARVSNLYEPLLFWDNDYKLAPALAESVEASSDAKQWTINLRQGVTFHNGKTMTAEDVLFSIGRVTGGGDPAKATSAGGILAGIIDLDASKAVDDNTVLLALKQPYAIIDQLLAEYTFGIIPSDWDAAKPVGTGAFSYSSFTPGKDSVFKKYADYWGTPAFVDELHIQDFADDSAKVNALLAGQIQTVDNLPTTLIDSVKAQGGSPLISDTGAWVPFTMRVDVAPFDDPRVRQAMRLIVDRQQMIDQALSGYGFLGNDMYAPFDPAYAKDLPQREQDLDQAKSLLKSAGAEGLQVELFTGDDIGSVATASASLFAEQAKGAGVDVKVTKKTPFYGEDYLSYPFAQDFWNTRLYIPQVGVCAVKGATYNETHWDNAKFAGIIDQASREVDETKRNALLQDAQQIEYDEGGYIIWGFRQQVDGYSSTVKGLEPSKYLPLGSYKFQNVSV